MDKALSAQDIIKALNNKTNVIIYSEIHKFRTLSQLLGPHKSCVILYERRKNFGHWTCVFEQSLNCVSFFDSLGIFIDEELNFCKSYYKTVQPYLSKLLRESRYKNIEYNEYILQKTAPKINTCGRHVICRLRCKTMPIYDYIRYLLTFGHNTDLTVYKLTKNI